MSTHSNCPHCGTYTHDGSIRVLIIDDNSSAGLVLALQRIGLAATEVANQFRQSAPWDVTIRELNSLQQVSIAEPTDPSIHLAPNHQDYTPNHRKQRRGKHKRSGR